MKNILSDEFDQFLRDKTSHVDDLPFSEEYWNQAKLLLKQQRGKTFPWKAYFISFILGTALMISFTCILGSNRKETIFEVNEIHSIQPSLNENSPLKSEKYSNFTENKTSLSGKIKNISLVDVKTKRANLNDGSPINGSGIEPEELVQTKQSINSSDQPKDISTFQNMQGIKPTIPLSVQVSFASIKEESVMEIETKKLPKSILNSFICDTCLPIRKQYVLNNPIAKKQTNFWALQLSVNKFNNGLTNTLGMGWQAGIRYHYVFTNNIGVQLGLDYLPIQQNLPDRNYYQTTYGFGMNKKQISLKTTALNYIGVPLSIAFPQKKKTEIHIGLEYLIIIASKEEKTVTDFGELVQTVKTKENNYLDASNKTDVLFSLGMSYHLSQRYYLNASLYQGIMDITNNKVYKSDTRNFNSGFSIGLGLKLN